MSIESAHTQRRKFAILLAIIQVIVAIFYGIFVKVEAHSDQTLNPSYYAMYQDVNVMMLIGFGFLMTFIKNYTWSTLSYTFFLNAVIVQLYLLMKPFWHTVFQSDGHNFNIEINQKTFTLASYSVASILIAFGAIIGKVGPLQLLVVGIVGIFGYTLNQNIVYDQLKLFDAGGSTAIHTFGAFYGLVVSFFISRTQQGKNFKPIKTAHINNTFAMIGSLFLWLFWPSFNAGVLATSPQQKSIIIANTVISLTASCLGAFVISNIGRIKFNMEDILNATLAGGVIIGAPSSLITHPAAAFTIGLLGGCISAYCFHSLAPKFQKFFHIHDSCGVHNLHGIPGFLGGILSAVVIAGYNSQQLDNAYAPFLPFSKINNIYGRTYTQQAGIQVAGTFMSLGIGALCGILTGIIISNIYTTESEEFYKDQINFEMPTPPSKNMNSTAGITQDELLQVKN